MKYHRRQCIHLLLQVILLTASCLAENLTLSINFKRRMFVTNGAFLSLTLDPAKLLNSTSALINNIEMYSSMMQGLVPAYIRFGGPRSNSYIYDRFNTDPNNVLFETHSTLIYRWVREAGLDVIACISPRYMEDKSETCSWESTNLAQLLFFNDHMGHYSNWQLGYECQTRYNVSGGDLGRYVANLRERLQNYPRYSDSLITGPDIVEYRTENERQYLRDYLSTAGDALSAITWHPDLAGVAVHGNDISVHPDNIAAEKDELYKAIGDIAVDKPLWIAESKPEEFKHKYIGALTWTRRLGNTAKLGVQVVMRQFLEFSRPTPDYWVSFLHKALVGREVLEVEVQSDDESHVHFYSQCTKPSTLYEKGALTIFGVNLTPREVTASLKGFEIKTLHEYILSPDSEAGNKMFAERVLLNGEPLELIDNIKLPYLNPEIVTDSDGVQLNLASGNIGFWVIPNAKVKACIYEEEGTTEDIAAKKLSKRHVIRQADEEEKQEGKDVDPFNSGNQELRVKQGRPRRRSKIEIQKHALETKLYRRIRRLLQKNVQQRGNNETSNLERPFTTILAREQKNTLEEAEKQENVGDKRLEETEKSDNETRTNDYIQTLEKCDCSPNRQARAEAERSFKRKVRDINNAMTLISKIEALVQREKDETTEDTVIERDRKFNEKYGEFAKKAEANTIEEIEKYFNTFHDLLENNELNTKNVENNRIPIHDNLTNKKRYTRNLSIRSRDPKIGEFKDIHVKRPRVGDLKSQIKQKMWRRNDDKKKTLPVDLKNLDNYKNTLHGLFRQYYLNKLLQGNNHRGNSQRSVFSIQKQGRTTRDIDRMSTDIGAKQHDIFRKHPRIDDVNERKSERKDDFQRTGLSSPLNLRTTDSGESGFNGFLRPDPIRGFPEADVFVTTTDASAQRSSLNYGYVEDDEDDSWRKKQESTIAEDTFWTKVDNDQRDYTPKEFYENVNLPNTRIRTDAKDYSDLYEAEFVVGKEESKDNDGSAAASYLQPLDEEKAMNVRGRSTQLNFYNNLRDKKYSRDADYEVPRFHSEYSRSLRQLAAIPITKYDFTNYQTSEARPEAAKQKPQVKSEFLSLSYQPSLVSLAQDNYGNFQASSMRPNVEYAGNSINNQALYNKINKRSNWKRLQEFFTEEMIKEDTGNAKDCSCRVNRACNSLKERFNNRIKRNQMSAIEASEAADTNAETNPDLARLLRDVSNPTTKAEFDRIMTGEILPSTSVIETESDHDKRDAVTVRSNKSHREANEAIQTVSSTPAMLTSETSDISAQQDIVDETFFRAQSSATSSEIEEATSDSTEAALEISSFDKKSRQEPFASDTEDTRQAATNLSEETQDFKVETQQESTDATTEGGKAEGERGDDREVSSKPNEETTERVAQERVTTEMSKRTARKTTGCSRSNRSRSRKRSKEPQRSENRASPSEQCKDEACVEEENRLKIITSVVQDSPTSQLRDLARYEEYLIRYNEQIQKLKDKLKERRMRHRNYPAKVTDEQTRNLKRRETWERFYENNFRHLIDQEKLFRFLANNTDARVSDEDDDNDEDDDRDEEDEEDENDGYLPFDFVPKRYDILRDQPHSRRAKHYPEYNSYHHLLRQPRIVEIEQKPVTLSISSDRKILAIDPSTYRGGEGYLETFPKYSPKIKFPTQALKDLYQTALKPAKLYENQRTFKPYDDYHSREFVRKPQINDAYERGNTVVLYLLDKHQRYDSPKELAELTRDYFNALDRRDIDQVAKYKIPSDLNNYDAISTHITARKIGQPKQIDKEYTRSSKTLHEELSNHRDENVWEKIDKSHEINDEVDDNINTGESNLKEGNVDDGDSEASGPFDTSSTTPRNRRNAEEQMDKSERTRADARTESNHDKYICIKEEDSEEEFGEQSIPLYQLTRFSPNAVLFRKLMDQAISSNEDFDRQEEEQSSKYVVLDKIEDVPDPYEMLGTKNPERSSERFGLSSWLDRYLPKRITNAMIRYLNDVSSEELEHDDSLNMSSESAEGSSDEEVSYALSYSDESSESRRKITRNIADEVVDEVADEVNCESREEDQQHGVKSKESHGHLKMKGQMRSEERRAFMPFPGENKKTKRQRRQAEVDKQKTKEFITTKNMTEDKNDEYYLQQNSINEKVTTSTDHPHIPKDEKIHDDLLEDFVNIRKNVITSTNNEGNNESLGNSVAKSNKKSSSFMEETIPKLQDVIMDGLEKAKDLTEPVEQFVDNFEENFTETSATDEETSSTNKTSGNTDNVFHLAITNIKKFFTLFTGISRILHA